MPATVPKPPNCKFCGKPMVQIETGTGPQGKIHKTYHCQPCDQGGVTHVYKRGDVVVGRP